MTDLHEYIDSPNFAPMTPHPVTKEVTPIVCMISPSKPHVSSRKPPLSINVLTRRSSSMSKSSSNNFSLNIWDIERESKTEVLHYWCLRTLTGAKSDIFQVFGHEFSGTVLETDANVTGFTPGQHVSIQPNIYDGTCGACTSSVENACYSGGVVGLSGWGGGLSDAVSVPANYVLPLPNNVPLDVAALVEPLSVDWHGVRQSPLKRDSTVLILGGGPIGIAVILALKSERMLQNNRQRTFDREK